MKTEAILFMVLILGIVWGGFAYLIYIAMRRERKG
jgi:threonine/homoserine/homoserine lactone efflux protein